MNQPDTYTTVLELEGLLIQFESETAVERLLLRELREKAECTEKDPVALYHTARRLAEASQRLLDATYGVLRVAPTGPAAEAGGAR